MLWKLPLKRNESIWKQLLTRIRFALVDFGLAQTYEKSSAENVFVYEKLNLNKRQAPPGGEIAGKKNLIAVPNSKKSTSAHLILTNTQQNRSSASVAKTDVNSMPDGPKKDRQTAQMSASQSFERDLASAAATAAAVVVDVSKTKTPDVEMSQPSTRVLSSMSGNATAVAALVAAKSQFSKPKTASPNLQKFHSFQKTSLLTETKCNCFSTQFVCDICTSR